MEQRTIYRFTASYCQPCKVLAKNLEIADVGIPIEVVDIEVHTDAAEAFGIRSVPTLVMVDGEKEISRLIGLKSVDQLRAWAI